MRSILFALLLILLVGCSSTPLEPTGFAESTPTAVSPTLIPTALEAPTPAPTAEAVPTDVPLPLITIPISVYIVDDENGRLSSSRDIEGLMAVYEKVNTIWAQANIAIEIAHIQRLTLPTVHVQSIWHGDFRPFFLGIDYDFPLPETSLINAFYAQQIGGPNGIVPFRMTLFFVNDEPSVHHERVTSHEIGHILGLHHTQADRGRLMFSGTNGTLLTPEEITVARYTAQGLLEQFHTQARKREKE